MSDVAYDPLRYARAGEESVDRAFTQVANRRAGQALKTGNYQQAAGALFGNGDIQGGVGVQNLQAKQQAAQKAQQAEQLARQVAFTRQATTTLRRAMNEGADPVAAFDSFAPAFTQLGIDPQTQATYRQALMANPTGFLDTVEQATAQQERQLEIINLGGGSAVAVDKATGEEVNRYVGQRQPIEVGGVLVDPNTFQPILDTREPKYQTITNSDGSTSLVAVDQPAPVAMTGAALAGGGAGAVEAMIPITLQSESQNRDFDANGNILTSPAGAQGRMQVMPGTNTDPGYGVTPARDGSVEERARVGRDYLAAMMRTYGNDPAKAWAAYNWGPGNLDRAIQQNGGNWLQAAPAETQQYVRQNLAALNRSGGQPQAAPQAQSGGARVVAQGADLGPTPSQRRADERSDRTGMSTLRREFNARPEVKEFREADNSFRQMQRYVQSPSAAGDLSLIFAFMKVLDPTSTVREGEFATASNAGSVDDSLRNRYNQVINGQRLQPRQRQDFLSQARNIMETRRDRYGQIVNEYSFEAEQQGFDPTRVIGQQEAPQGRTESPVPNVPQSLWATSSPQQQQWWQANPPRGARGSATNPLRINPNDIQTSLGNVRPDQYYLTPDGRVARRQPTQRRRTR